MSVQASFLAAVLPISAYLFFLWYADRFERESFLDLLKHFFWGALGAVFLSLLGGKFYSNILEFFIPKGEKLLFIESIFLAPLFEEFSKAAFLILTLRSKKLDNVTDGLIFGGSIGLGFGMVENFFYFILFSSNIKDWVLLVLFRTFFSAVMHTISTAAAGAFFAKTLYSGHIPKSLFYAAGISLAVLIHFIWNISVTYEGSFYLGLLLMLILTTLFIIYFSMQRTHERKIIVNELKEECDEGIIPYHYLPILTSAMKDKKGWISEKIRKDYVESATKLAFRKDQLKKVNKDFDFYKKGIMFYKNRLIELVQNDES